MSLVRLRTFIEVYRQGSISGAARALNLTQPAVSQHIAGLEVAVGRQLFERQSNGVQPTSAADDLAADVGDRLDAAEAALSAARARSQDVSGVLQIIGHADFLAEVIVDQLPPLLQAGIRVHLHTGSSDLITQMLLEGHCDLGISAFGATDKRLKSELILTTDVLAVAAPAVVQRLSAAKQLGAALLDEPLLAYNLELPLINHWLERNRLQIPELRPAMVGQDLRTLRNVLVKGLGWSVLPQYLCQQQIASGELLEIPSPLGRTQLNYYLLWTPSALRQPRVAHARQALLWHLRSDAGQT